jgi:hypothetical protein
VWSIVKPFWIKMPVWTIVLCLPFALVIGGILGGLKLIEYTEEYRDWLYEMEIFTQTDIDGDNVIGVPDPENPTLPKEGTHIRGIDGQFHRIDTQLNSEEIQEVKRLLLLGQKATVRSLTNIMGERASRFRDELIDLGICDKPEYERGAAPLSRVGERTVMRW